MVIFSLPLIFPSPLGDYNPRRFNSTKRKAIGDAMTMLKDNCPDVLITVILFNDREQRVADCKKISREEYKLDYNTHFYDVIDRITGLIKGPLSAMFLTDGKDTYRTTDWKNWQANTLLN